MQMTAGMEVVQHSCAIGKKSGSCIDLLTKQELDLVNSKAAEINYRKGEIICKQGGLANQIMIVREGLVKIYMETNSGKDLVLQIMPSMNIIGLSALFDGNSVYQFSARTYLDTNVQVIESSLVKQLIRSNPEFALHIVGMLAEYNTIISGRFFCLTHKQSYGRFSDVILCLANRIYKDTQFPLQLSRKQLAEIAGLSIESVARILTHFKEEKLIEIDNKQIRILDYERMCEISFKG